MSRLMCSCGVGLADSNVPSDNVLYVFAKTDIDNALLNDANITLYDFETCIESTSEFWYCTNCKRVLVVENIPDGEVVVRYSVSLSPEEEQLQDLTAFYVFSDVDIYNAEEMNPDIKLSDFITRHGESHLYYTDNSKSAVYRLIQDNRYRRVYVQE